MTFQDTIARNHAAATARRAAVYEMTIAEFREHYAKALAGDVFSTSFVREGYAQLMVGNGDEWAGSMPSMANIEAAIRKSLAI